MGALVSDPSVPQIQVVLNNRFAPGDPLREMIAIQKEFDVFSPEHSLARICSLLNIAPPEAKDRRGWFKYCNHLRDIPSETKGTSAHDKIIAVLKENLESKAPLPVYFGWHPGTKLDVSKGDRALVFSKVEYLRISVPVGHA